MIGILLALQLSVPLTDNENLIHIALAGVIIAHSADLSTTSWAIGRNPDKFREANPLMRPFADDPIKLAVVKMGTAGSINYMLFRLHKNHPKLTLILAVIQIPVFS